MTNRTLWKWPLLVTALFVLHGAVLGLTDDEAYYWVLAQTPSLSYAYHPPAVAWLIAISELIWSPVLWLFSAAPHPIAVRFPAAVCAGLLVWFFLQWLRSLGVNEQGLRRAPWMLVAFPGFFGAAWMIVPDLPLFLGWMMCFWATWRLCFLDAAIDHPQGGSPEEFVARERGLPTKKAAEPRSTYVILALGVMLSGLSKYSGVFHAISAAAALYFFRAPGRHRGLGAIVAGGIGVLVPVLFWNAQHEWVSILYQVRDRHSGGFSLLRFARFWGIQLLVAGPFLVAFFFLLARRVRGRLSKVPRFIAIWAGPPAFVYLLQPLFAEFKPHWAFVIWLPLAMELAYRWVRGESRLARAQLAFGLPITAIALVMCHVPVVPALGGVFSGEPLNARMDVTNDMYGWQGIAEFVRSRGGEKLLELPIVGSRYQTAAQAAFVWPGAARDGKYSLEPKAIRDWDEWPRLGIEEAPARDTRDWPVLTRELVYAADNRYTAAPGFRNADCRRIGRHDTERRFLWVTFHAKSIDLWYCRPQ